MMRKAEWNDGEIVHFYNSEKYKEVILLFRFPIVVYFYPIVGAPLPKIG